MTTKPMMTTRFMRHDSRDDLPVLVKANVELNTQPVYIAAEPWDSIAEPTFYPAEWVGSPGVKREAQILIGPGGGVVQLARGTYLVLVKITDAPKAPIVEAYQLKIT